MQNSSGRPPVPPRTVVITGLGYACACALACEAGAASTRHIVVACILLMESGPAHGSLARIDEGRTRLAHPQ